MGEVIWSAAARRRFSSKPPAIQHKKTVNSVVELKRRQVAAVQNYFFLRQMK
jgi:hypothetical protein